MEKLKLFKKAFLLFSLSLLGIASLDGIKYRQVNASDEIITTYIGYGGGADEFYPYENYFYEGRYLAYYNGPTEWSGYALNMRVGGSITYELSTDFVGCKIHAIRLGFRGSYYDQFEAYAFVKTSKVTLFEAGTKEKGVEYYDLGYTGWNYDTQFCPVKLNNEDYLVGEEETLTIEIGCTYSRNDTSHSIESKNSFQVCGLEIDYIDAGASIRKPNIQTSLACSYVNQGGSKVDSHYELVTNVNQLKDNDLVFLASASSVFSDSNFIYGMAIAPGTFESGVPADIFSKINIDDSYYDYRYIYDDAFDSNLYRIDKTEHGFIFTSSIDSCLACSVTDSMPYLTFESNSYSLEDLDRNPLLWNISIDNARATIVNQNETCKYRYLGVEFDGHDTRFDCFTGLSTSNSDDQRLAIYRLSKCKIYSTSLRFGLRIKASTYNAVINANGHFGFAVGKGDIDSIGKNSKLVGVIPARVDERGIEDENGDFYQFAVVINNIPESDWDVTISAKAFAVVDDVYSFSEGASASIKSVARAYFDIYPDNDAVRDNFSLLKILSGNYWRANYEE